MRNLLLLLVLACYSNVAAQEPANQHPSEDQLRDQLRVLRERMFKTYTQRDVPALLADVEENVVATWQNGDRVLNKQEFVEFYNRMMNGADRIVDDVSSDFKLDGPSLIYGTNTAIAYGTCVDHFKLRSGNDFDLASKWTATIVKTDGNWKVASFHISADMFDNPILRAAQRWLIYAGIVGGVVGLIAGYLLTLVFSRRSTVAAS